MPNRACSGHGYAVGQRWRFEGKAASPTVVPDKHAGPLTPSLGRRSARKGKKGAKPPPRAEILTRAGRQSKVKEQARPCDAGLSGGRMAARAP